MDGADWHFFVLYEAQNLDLGNFGAAQFLPVEPLVRRHGVRMRLVLKNRYPPEHQFQLHKGIFYHQMLAHSYQAEGRSDQL